MSGDAQSLQDFAAELRAFRRARRWERYHTPRNLAISLSIEAAELLEHFQWLTDEEAAARVEERREAIASELADVAIHALQLADVAAIDLGAAIADKIRANAERYPVELARGNARKHSELRDR